MRQRFDRTDQMKTLSNLHEYGKMNKFLYAKYSVSIEQI